MTDFSIDVPLLFERNFFDSRTCEHVRRAMDRGADDDAEILAEAIVVAKTIRRTRSVDVDNASLGLVEARLEQARPALQQAFGCRLGPREGTGFLRYLPGGFYLPHRDRGDVTGWPGAARRAVAVVVFLNGGRTVAALGDFEGGSLCLYPGPGCATVEIRPETGLLVAFPADLLHEVRLVTSGIRDTAVDWFYDWTGD